MRECLSTMTAIKLTNAATKSCIATTPTPVATALASPAVTISMQTVYIAGRYNKYSKELSQTPWMLNGVLKTPHSVLSRMESHFLTATKCSSVVFSSSGREDVDVRMLGRGRPFVMECVNPKRQMTTAMLSTLQRTVNESCSDMRINDIQVVTKEETLRNREDDSDKRKKYLATVTFAEAQTDDSIKALNETGEFLIQQQTPVRVLHRRPLLTRPRMIYASHLQLTSPFNGLLTLTTQAGTYIKEFCHGDLGRTVPNLSTFLKCDCDISDLDVADVEMDWPPRIEQDF
ncbi:hypothetical protein SARC_00674 [Sphaeroforma arctica JP610]|uniref:tRNA pseudouridine(55) synthase n=1 Tax=Sphaeroforma arctica JP610 TaxID=667725 RepID=A0A0L0GDU9_9EUKA|nr:hypothetical protein SARC_00674 [Sphaeroforma arctica JP610]KNC87197.1 hypothetical protein SARC_00674 [Sphaeroforma arctica JP610]|eukprot:XP_014161099.1 hypothetical protein SARC_00674 [Sphaeroforma arctica JP610]